MEKVDLTKGPAEFRGVEMSYGGAALQIPVDKLTYLYSPRGGMLSVGKEEIEIPARSFTVLNEGVTGRYRPAQPQLSDVVARVSRELPKLTPEQQAFADTVPGSYGTDMTQWHDGIRQYLGGEITVLPKFVDGKHVVGWPSNARKGQVLQGDTAEWSELRANEVYHYHRIISEFYVGIHGAGTLLINDEPVQYGVGDFIYVPVGDRHKITSITPGPEGLYIHLCLQYPPVKPDLGEKILV